MLEITTAMVNIYGQNHSYYNKTIILKHFGALFFMEKLGGKNEKI